MYKSLVGSLQWDVSIVHLDITISVMVLFHFRATPCAGNLERTKIAVSYLNEMRYAKIRFCTSTPY